MSAASTDIVETVDIQRLRDFAARALAAVGLPEEHAGFAADALAWSQLHGHPHHSVSGGRLRQCLTRIQRGGSNPRPTIALGSPDAAFARAAGDNALGLVAGVVAMRAAIERAQRFGVGMVVVRDISTLAALGYYATLAIDVGMIGAVLTNGSPLVGAPEGGRRVICNQAHAIGCPTGEGFPFLFDSALSVMSTVAIAAAHERGELLPEGVLRDRDGRPTRDPSPEAVRTGTLLPAGGYRGFGLGLAFELLTGVIGGGEISSGISNLSDPSVPTRGSSAFIAVDPTDTMDVTELTARVDQFLNEVRASGPPGGPSPHIPGERGYRLAAERRLHGVPLTAADIDGLDAIRAELEIAAW
jgi:LDH2 family malate/lactate/ureidoglycolate dehydrogenase